jgi:hypothetical protein
MKLSVAIACGVLVSAAAGLAVAAVADPPPPSGLDRDQIDRWVGQYIEKGADVEAASTDDMVLFYTPSTVKKAKECVESVVRGEQFILELIPPGPIRSFRDVWRFDCAGRRFLLVESEIFPRSTLQGTPVRLDTSMERWSQSFQEGVGPGSLIAQVCRDAGVAVGGAELPPRDGA